MGGKGGSGSSPDVVYLVLERSSAMDLLNALYIALGIIPKRGKESEDYDGGKLEGKSGGGAEVKGETGGKLGGAKIEISSKGGGGKIAQGGKPKGVKAGGSGKTGKGK